MFGKCVRVLALSIPLSMSLAGTVFAKCDDVTISYAFVTKADAPKEADKGPTYVSPTGGYLPDENISCKSGKIKFRFLGAHYAKDPGTGLVRVEVYGKKQEKLGEKITSVAEWITNWQDVSNSSKRKEYSGTIQLPKKSDISKIRIFVVPGNWAVVINDMTVSFE